MLRQRRLWMLSNTMTKSIIVFVDFDDVDIDLISDDR